jgi:hypothetical protein
MFFHIELHDKILTLGKLLKPGFEKVMKNVKNMGYKYPGLISLKSLSLVIYLFILKVAAEFTFLIFIWLYIQKFVSLLFYHETVVKQDHCMEHCESCTVKCKHCFWCSRCRIHQYVAATFLALISYRECRVDNLETKQVASHTKISSRNFRK